MIGKKLSPILVEIEDTLWEFECYSGRKPEYTEEAFRASIKIFMSALMDKMWEVQNFDEMSMEDRGNMATKAGESVRELVKTYTGLDTHKLYEKA